MDLFLKIFTKLVHCRHSYGETRQGIYIYIYVCVCVCVCIHMYEYIYIYACMYMCVCECVYVCEYVESVLGTLIGRDFQQFKSNERHETYYSI